jgi:hypothetical protein
MAPPEGIAYPFDTEKYELGYSARDDLMQVAEYVPTGETVYNWSELVTMVTTNKRAFNLPDSRQMMESIRSDMAGQCPGLQWRILEEAPGSILYEWWVQGCGDVADQHEIARILQSDWNCYHLKYTIKGPPMANERREEWIGTLASARVLRL